jgi:hypothetical protein
VDRAGRKAQGEVGEKTYRLLRRAGIAADRLMVQGNALQEAYRLKKVNPIPFLEEGVF